MATYYVDPENHTGTASDTVGGGTSASNAYRNLAYCFGDINVTHGIGTPAGDVIKMIGVYAPDDTECNSLTSNVVTYTSGNNIGVTIISDGATAFGTASPTSRATMSQANCTLRIINSTVASYITIDGFTCTGFLAGNYMFSLGAYARFQNCYCDMTAQTNNPKLFAGRNYYTVDSCYIKSLRTTGSGGAILGIYTGSNISNNFVEIDDTAASGGALTSHLQGANSGNTYTGNFVWLKRGAGFLSCNASGIQVIGNTVVGDAKVYQYGSQFWINAQGSVYKNNHFENLHQVVGYLSNGGSGSANGIQMYDNTFYNCNYTTSVDPSWTRNSSVSFRHTARNVTLPSSGVVDAANGDLRPSLARRGSNAINGTMDLSQAWIDAQANGAGGNSSVTQYRPFG